MQKNRNEHTGPTTTPSASSGWIRGGVFSAMLALSATSFAQGPGWTNVSTVIGLVNTSNGGVNVRLSPELVNCVSQAGYGSNYASIFPSHPGINRIKADLLSALLTGAKVQLYLYDSSCNVAEMILTPP